MTISTSLQTQITAIQNRINAIAATATPEDITLLAKAVEAISGHVTVFDIIQTGNEQIAAVNGAFTTQIAAGTTAITSAQSTGVAAVNTAKDAAIAAVNPNNFSLAYVHAASLSM